MSQAEGTAHAKALRWEGDWNAAWIRVMVESLDFVLSMRGNPVRNHPQPQETPATKLPI